MAMSKENNGILPKDIKKRIYKSRKQRPCDNCRKRKSCCIIENGIPCKLCKMFNKKCTFEKGPVYNNKKSTTKAEQSIDQFTTPSSTSSSLSPKTITYSQQQLQQSQPPPQQHEQQQTEEEGLSTAFDLDFLNDPYNSCNSYNLYNPFTIPHNPYNSQISNMSNESWENYVNLPLDLDMNLDSLQFSANFFDFSLEYDQMR